MVQLSEMLRLSAPALVALVGAGGKTTTMYTLARELAGQGRRVVTTTTTHIASPQPGETECLLIDADMEQLPETLQRAWRDYHHITVASEIEVTGKLKVVSPELPALCLQRGGAEVVVVEADGARHLKIKAPAAYEPVIPPQATHVFLLLSAEALNQSLDAELAHRPEILARLTGIAEGDALTPTVVARLLLHQQGGLKGIPARARAYVLVTHATDERRAAVAELADLLRGSSRIAGLFCSAQPGDWQSML